jgi:hypothetical protein
MVRLNPEAFREDVRLIHGVRALDTFHLALTIHAVYVYIVTGFGNVEGWEHIVWSIKVSRLVCSFTQY